MPQLGYAAPMRVACFQQFPIFDDPASAAAAIARELHWADEQGVHLALFPEACLHGHAYDRPTIEGRAVGLDDPALEDVLGWFAPFKAAAILGLFERRGKRLFNSAIVVEKGRVTGVYAKAHPNEEGITPGTDFPVFQRRGRSFGINICYDANHPETARKIADQGADLLCYPLNNLLRPEKAEIWRRRSIETLQARARETGCWVASADVAGSHGGRLSYGCTAIISPDGEVAARVPELCEGAALFDIAAGAK